ncbi:hypothetical protein KEM55_005439 [Ascosphaera atra]|nr:hypothetical protein KEM55_005439 [Ascosphaera atra]
MTASLAASVTSLQSSLESLESSIDILDEGVKDFPRIRRVLQSQQHFELLPEPTLHEAQKAVMDEITPSIAHLLTVASNHIERMGRRVESLKARSELQQGRLSQRPESAAQSSRRGGGYGQRANEPASIARTQELRRLQQKRERLQYMVEGLELQRKQKERQLRKSMAFQ